MSQAVALTQAPAFFDLALPNLKLEDGSIVGNHHLRGWSWGPREAPVVLVVHALTGDARAGGPGGFWEPLIGPGRAIDTDRYRVLCFNNLGSCYGSSGPTDPAYPAGARLSANAIAASLGLALDALKIDRVHLVVGGSLGGMITLSLAAQQPSRIERILPLAATADASAWIVGFNHVQRQVIAADPSRGLELARQLAMLTYRAEAGLDALQSRGDPPKPGAKGRYRVQGYLEYQGEKLRKRFDTRSYLALLDAMDEHDLLRGPVRIEDVRSSALVVDVDTDALFTPAQVEKLADYLREGGNHVERKTITSLHGHDAFLIEWAQLDPIVRRALALPIRDRHPA